MTNSGFPILDSSYAYATAEFGRVVLDFYGYVEPHIAETDSWIAMPLRLVHDEAAGWHLECGPYSFDHADMDRLRSAIAAYDEATKPAPRLHLVEPRDGERLE